MKAITGGLLGAIIASPTLLLFVGCGAKQVDRIDRPRLSSTEVMRDEVFFSPALGRNMRYRIVVPASIGSSQKFPVVYLLHGAGGDFRDWTDYSDAARYADGRWILVMPQGDYSYFVNAVGHPADRYEDYIVRDLFSEVETKFPVAPGRATRAIAGVSMGASAR